MNERCVELNKLDAMIVGIDQLFANAEDEGTQCRFGCAIVEDHRIRDGLQARGSADSHVSVREGYMC